MQQKRGRRRRQRYFQKFERALQMHGLRKIGGERQGKIR